MPVRRAFPRLWRRLDPRRSVAARLLLGFSLAFAAPGLLFVLFLQRRVTAQQSSAAQQIAAVRVTETAARMAQDASFRAEWVDRRARVAEEAAWSLAAVAAELLSSEVPATPTLLARDAHGHLITPESQRDSLAFVSARAPDEQAARRDAARAAPLSPLMRSLRERRPTIRRVTLWTASGLMLQSPGLDFHQALRRSRGALETFALSGLARFPEVRPADGDSAVWPGPTAGPASAPDERRMNLLVPVRNREGRLAAAVGLEIEGRRYVAEALETWPTPGDFWFATDAAGRAISMTPRSAALLGWRGGGETGLRDQPGSELARLAGNGLGAPRSMEVYRIDGKIHRIASARVPATGWVFFEGLSSEAMDLIRAEASRDIPPASYTGLNRYALLLFVLLLGAVLAAAGIVSRRISRPVEELVHAAEEVGRGKTVALAAPGSTDEIGRLGTAIGQMSRRVARRVETLRRLHQFSRSAYRMTDLQEVLARCTQAIAAFTEAERVWFYLHDPNTRRLEAALPAWNLPEGTAAKLQISVEARSIEGMVFRTGETYWTNDLDRDPYANPELRRLVGATNGVFTPLKTEEETLGVAVATNRPGGFAPEEIDAVTSFADIASLLIRNARLYATLTGTVDELKRASRLKDHFLQNVNHELRTPLTAIVGWTDLFEEEPIDEATLQRGLRQMRQSARVLLALIDDLLDLARLDRGALTLDLRSVSLSEVTQRSLETVRLMAEARGVVLILAPLPEPMPPVRADALRLQQILWNLLSNAIHFTPQHGRIVVRVEREPERYLISVEDDGIGIPESELPYVFERFRQVDGSATRGHAGMGIGLALAKSLVGLHGGTIWATSVVGQGSRFTFSVPFRPATRDSEPGETPATAAVERVV